MTRRKTVLVAMRFAPETKQLAELIAERERRSVTNMVEGLILDRAQKLKIKLDPTPPPSDEE